MMWAILASATRGFLGEALTINDMPVHLNEGEGGGGTVRIEVSRRKIGLHGGPEVWVRVLSTEVVDWPTVQSKLDRDIRAELQGKTMNYHPGNPTKDETDVHGYTIEDFWVWSE